MRLRSRGDRPGRRHTSSNRTLSVISVSRGATSPHGARIGVWVFAILSSSEVLAEKVGELAERDQLHPVVQVHVASARNHHEFLRFGGELVRFLAELARVRFRP